MSELLQRLWQANIEISLLLIIILLARFAIRKTTKIYNAYLLWLCIPVGVLVAKLMSQVELHKPPVESVNKIVQNYIVQPAESFDTWLFVGYLWLAVALALLLRLVFQHLDLRRNLREISIHPSTLKGFSTESKYPIVVIEQEGFSPAVYGFFKPRIFFPIHLTKSLSEDQISLIIQHEEHHIKQQHLWLNLLWDVVVCLMWFNPLVYLSRQNFRHDQELFCDYLVLNNSSQQQHKNYGHALLSTISATHSVSLLCSWKAFDQLEERIMNIKRPSSFGSKLLLSISGVVIVCCTAFYTVNAAEYSKQESFRHEQHDYGGTEISWNKDGKTLITANRTHFVIDENGKYEMTPPERKPLETQVEWLQQEWGVDETQAEEHQREQVTSEQFEREYERASRVAERELQRTEREAHRQEQREHSMQQNLDENKEALELAREIEQQQIEHEHQLFENEQKQYEFHTQQSEIETQQEELQVQQDEFETQWQEFTVQQQEFDTQMQEFEMQMHEYEIAPEIFQEQLQELSIAERDFKELYVGGQLSDETMRQVERSLAIAEKQFKTDRVDLKKKLKQARAGINKARIQMHKQRASLHRPKAPSQPVSPEAPIAPKTPAVPVAPGVPETPLAINQLDGVIQIPNEFNDLIRAAANQEEHNEKRASEFESFNFSEPH